MTATELPQRIAVLVAKLGAARSQLLAIRLRGVTSLNATLIDTISADVAGQPLRSVVRSFLTYAAAPPNSLALAIETAVAGMLTQQLDSVELVWTGPHGASSALRDTEQVLLEITALAQDRLTLCAFTAYKISSVAQAMRQALGRGVTIEFIHESPDESEGRILFDPTDALEAELRGSVLTYTWPRAQRPTNRLGQFGSLHAKFALADSAALFVTSANLTEHALRINMELGMLVRSSRLAQQMRRQLDKLLTSGTLERTR